MPLPARSANLRQPSEVSPSCEPWSCAASARRFRPEDRPIPTPGPGQVLVRVAACAVCRTDLHLVDGELAATRARPIVPGHEIIGRVAALGPGVERLPAGRARRRPLARLDLRRVRVLPQRAREPVPERPLHGLPDRRRLRRVRASPTRASASPSRPASPTSHAAPLMCAGLIGYRTLRMAGDARRLGIYGFGAAAHIAAQVARWEGREVFAFTRPGDTAAQAFARGLGAAWAGGSDAGAARAARRRADLRPGRRAGAGGARARSRPGGTVVCGGIHMSDIPAFPYRLLWMERAVRSVANLTRRDGEEFLAIAARIPVRTETTDLPARRGQRGARAAARGALHRRGGAGARARGGLAFPRRMQEDRRMQYRRLGQSGLKVSAICLGSMTFGRGADQAETTRMVDAAPGGRRELHRHRRRLQRPASPRHARPRPEGPPPRGRAGHQGVQPDGARGRTIPAFARPHHARRRGQPAPAADRLARPLLPPPCGRADAAGGNAARARRPGAPGQGPLRRRSAISRPGG